MHLLRKIRFGLAFVLIASGFGITSPNAATSPRPGETGQDQPSGTGTGGAAQSTGYRRAGDRHKVQVSGERMAREMPGRGGRLIADYGDYPAQAATHHTRGKIVLQVAEPPYP